MHVQIKAVRIELIQGDITAQRMDAIVNAANTSLLGGGGVDGAIHTAAGPELLAETRKLGGCQVGEAKITKGYRLPARRVIHTVGPIYQPNDLQAPTLLASAYRRSLEVAAANDVISIAFPSISTGAYHYPLEEASRIALGVFIHYAEAQTPNDSVRLIRMVLYNTATLAIYERTLAALLYAK